MRTHPISTRTTLILAAIVLLAPLINSLVVRGPQTQIAKSHTPTNGYPAAVHGRTSPT